MPHLKQIRKEGKCCLFKAEKCSLSGKKSLGSSESAKEGGPDDCCVKVKNCALDREFFFYSRSVASLILATCQALALFLSTRYVEENWWASTLKLRYLEKITTTPDCCTRSRNLNQKIWTEEA